MRTATWADKTAAQKVSTPHPRGWSGTSVELMRPSHVDPAPAGMVRCTAPGIRATSCRPRPRGDGPPPPTGQADPASSTPHPRGWSANSPEAALRRCVDPAPAGMVRGSRSRACPGPGRPRTRGDGPTSAVPGSLHATSTPHPRGWSRRSQLHPQTEEVDPAPAGMVRRRRRASSRSVRRPRTRGDGPTRRRSKRRRRSSTPHPRGWSGSRTAPSARPEVDPAPAGMVRTPPLRWCTPPGRPRTRGDGPTQPHNPPPKPPTYRRPRTRGDGPRWRHHEPLIGRRPRTRGDGPQYNEMWSAGGWSTPHPRGWSSDDQRLHPAGQVDPAPAGMVRSASCREHCTTSRPRTRGDGPPGRR